MKITDRMIFATLVLLAGCCSTRTTSLFPPGPTLAIEVLDHGAVAIAAARWRESVDASEAVVLTGNDAVDQANLAESQRVVRARWAPVADAMRALRVAADAYRAAVDRGEPAGDVEVLAALCGLRAVMPERWRALVPVEEVCR